uniref:Si:ch73-335m24.2 n=1 Tax=Xiphophorus couchianus TaxID=32473 RepID=A0A3B5MRK9_9TELE
MVIFVLLIFNTLDGVQHSGSAASFLEPDATGHPLSVPLSLSGTPIISQSETYQSADAYLVLLHNLFFPEHHHTRLVCENERLRLLCKNESVLAIYSATFGHLLHGSPNCPEEPGSKSDMGLKQTFKCLSAVALRKVSRRCHGRENCSIFADTQTFGDPCFPGTRKHLITINKNKHTCLHTINHANVEDSCSKADGGWGMVGVNLNLLLGKMFNNQPDSLCLCINFILKPLNGYPRLSI